MEAICMIGKSGVFTISQLESARRLILYFIEHHRLTPDKIYAHSDLDSRKPHCCGLPIKEFIQACINLESLDRFVWKHRKQMQN